MIINNLLLLSGSGFGILSIFIFYYNLLPLYFKILLFQQTILTLLFWSNPIKNRNTNLHIFDKFVVTLFIFSFIFYKIFLYQKNVILFIILGLISLFFFYLSYINSKKKWCSKKHIIFHFIAHIFSITSLFIAI